MTTESDRELLELAAKAAGHQVDQRASFATWRDSRRLALLNQQGGHTLWNSFADDGDALRLAVACGLVVDASRPSAGEPFKRHHFGQDDAADPYAATRRAITRAAASIGRGEG